MSRHQLRAWAVVASMVYLLLVAVGVVGDGFSRAVGGREGAERLFAFATNPFVGVLLGSLTTALVQSSSTVTSVIVGMVAGGLPVSLAIPMVMGANMGTTITNTLVSLGHISHRDEFTRAFAAATIHDWFNLLSIVVFLPLEIWLGLLERLSLALVGVVGRFGSLDMEGLDVVGRAVGPGRQLVSATVGWLPERWGGGRDDRPRRRPDPHGDHVSRAGAPVRHGGASESAAPCRGGSRTGVGDPLWHRGHRSRAVLVHHHEPDGPAGRKRGLRDPGGVPIHAGCQHRDDHHRDPRRHRGRGRGTGPRPSRSPWPTFSTTCSG